MGTSCAVAEVVDITLLSALLVRLRVMVAAKLLI
jgi:hypothetical protein